MGTWNRFTFVVTLLPLLPFVVVPATMGGASCLCIYLFYSSNSLISPGNYAGWCVFSTVLVLCYIRSLDAVVILHLRCYMLCLCYLYIVDLLMFILFVDTFAFVCWFGYGLCYYTFDFIYVGTRLIFVGYGGLTLYVLLCVWMCCWSHTFVVAAYLLEVG
jgi:hypothetical protein